MGAQMGHSFDLLLGRTTFDIFAAHWPHLGDDDPGAGVINRARKYVVSHRPVTLDWKTTIPITGDVAGKIKQLKREDGPEIQAQGRRLLIPTLLEPDTRTAFMPH